ncbi:MAG: hypothetical protein WDN69_06595 [Aliidongia sp.]
MKSTATTPAFSFITPNLCHDGHDEPCKDGEPGGLASADVFLKQWVPVITGSPAFRKDGLLIVTSTRATRAAPSPSPAADSSSPLPVQAAAISSPARTSRPFRSAKPMVRPRL